MTPSDRSTPSLLSVVALTAVVAATIAVSEAAALLLTGLTATPRTTAALVLTGAGIYAGAAAAVAAVWAFLWHRRSGYAPATPVAVAGTVAIELAVVVVSFADRPGLGRPVVLGALLGAVFLVYRGARRLVVAQPWLQRPDVWLSGLALALAATFLSLSARGTLPRATAAATLGSLVVVAGIAVAWWRRQTRWGPAASALAVGAAAGMFVSAGAATTGDASGADRSAPSILLVTIDTLRSDHLGAYGYADAQSPHIDRLAAEGATFLEALSPMPETGPAHASILSGLYPWHHGATRNGTPMAAEVTTLADVLGVRDYATAAIVSGWTVSARASGLAPHFSFYDDNFSRYWWLPDAIDRLRLVNVFTWLTGRWGPFRPRHERNATATSQAAVEWLAQQDGRPFFLWAHFYDPHGPYDPPARFAALHGARANGTHHLGWYRQPPEAREAVLRDPIAVRDMIARYDGEISYTDFHFARLRAAAERAATGRPLLIVLTADHGESLTEHSHFFDHLDLYDVNLRVPLIVHYPGRVAAGARLSGQTRLTDLAPTILDLLELPPLPRGDGTSLVPRLRGAAGPDPGPAFAHSPRGSSAGGSVWTARNGGYKLITTESWWADTLRFPATEELYDLRNDPAEEHAMACTGPAADSLRAALGTVRRENVPRGRSADPGVEERLRALGYGN